jgi:hypothetical protein
MKLINYSYLIFIVMLSLSSCMSEPVFTTPTWTGTQPPTRTSIPPTATLVARPTHTATLTPAVLILVG